MAKAIVRRIEYDWYDSLLSDLRKLEFTGIVFTKHAIGLRILQDELKFGKSEYGSKRIENLAKDLQVSWRDLYYCVQFARQYPEIATPLQNLSWRKVIALLPAPKSEKPETPALPEGKYNVIYADPPWEYRNEGVEGAAIDQYPTMSIEKISAIPVSDVTPENAVLFLWTTNPILEECFPVIKSWGFDYKTNFCWLKSNRKTGIGFYIRGVHELLLICIKGSWLPTHTPLSIIKSPAGRHSVKPMLVYELIEKMYPASRYLELFSRLKKGQERKNWTHWGNEIIK